MGQLGFFGLRFPEKYGGSGVDFFRVTNNALQIHGGYGYMLEYPVQRVFRDLRCESIGGGTSQIQREIIGKELDL